MTNDAFANVSLRRIHRLLKTLAELAKEASLTGFLEEGAQNAVQQYNLILQHLNQAGLVPMGLFQPLPIEANYAELGVASILLASFIEEDLDKPSETPAPATSLVRSDPQELKELQELGQLIREHLPELLQRRATARVE